MQSTFIPHIWHGVGPSDLEWAIPVTPLMHTQYGHLGVFAKGHLRCFLIILAWMVTSL